MIEQHESLLKSRCAPEGSADPAPHEIVLHTSMQK